MADRPRDDSWWIASDGKWYPPTLQPDPNVVLASEREQAYPNEDATSVPGVLTRVVVTTLVATAVAFAVAAFFGLRYGSALGSETASAETVSSLEDVFLRWSSFALLAMVATGVFVLVWTFRTSRSFDARGTTRRRWRGGWTIGAWFVPLASFVLPKLVFNELEKISQVPFAGDDVGDRWKEETRSAVGDLWWMLWVAGLFMYQMTQVFMTDPAVDAGTVAVATSLSGAAHAVLAGAAVALALVVRRIDTASRA